MNTSIILIRLIRTLCENGYDISIYIVEKYTNYYIKEVTHTEGISDYNIINNDGNSSFASTLSNMKIFFCNKDLQQFYFIRKHLLSNLFPRQHMHFIRLGAGTLFRKSFPPQHLFHRVWGGTIFPARFVVGDFGLPADPKTTNHPILIRNRPILNQALFQLLRKTKLEEQMVSYINAN